MSGPDVVGHKRNLLLFLRQLCLTKLLGQHIIHQLLLLVQFFAGLMLRWNVEPSIVPTKAKEMLSPARATADRCSSKSAMPFS